MVLQLLFTYAPPLQAVFGNEAIPLDVWPILFAGGLVFFLVVELEKLILRSSSSLKRAVTAVEAGGVIQSDADLMIPPKDIPMLTTDRDRMLLERLNRHPHLRVRLESLLAVVEDTAGDGAKADAAERRVIDELRPMGNEVLTAWAERGVEKQEVLAQAEPAWRPGGKKDSTGTPPLV